MPKAPHEPVRTCVACRQEAAKQALLRIVRGPDGSARVDRTGRAPGRGAYLHRDAGCHELARKRRHLERSLSASVDAGFWADLTT
jgi:uncharacterized protein